jgi:hypothetical protein
MKAKIYGVGGYTDQILWESVQMAAEELKMKVEIEKIEDIESFMKLGIWAIPALLLGETLVSYGRVPCISELKRYIVDQFNKEKEANSMKIEPIN